MFVMEFGRWWYGAGWAHLIRASGQRIRGIVLAFSLPILIRTLFDPWRRIISYDNNHSLQGMLRAMLDNAISRFVGFGVRVVVMLAAVLLVIVTSGVALISIVSWPLLPLAGIALIIRGVLPW